MITATVTSIIKRLIDATSSSRAPHRSSLVLSVTEVTRMALLPRIPLPRTPLNRGKKRRGRGLRRLRPNRTSCQLRAYWHAAGTGALSGCPSGSVCAGFLVKMLKPAVGLAPAMGLPEQSSAGTFSWTNANAGAAVATSISAATKAAANPFFALLNRDLLFRAFPYNVVYTHIAFYRLSGCQPKISGSLPCELLRTPLPRTPVNSGQEKGQSILLRPAPHAPRGSGLAARHYHAPPPPPPPPSPPTPLNPPPTPLNPPPPPPNPPPPPT